MERLMSPTPPQKDLLTSIGCPRLPLRSPLHRYWEAWTAAEKMASREHLFSDAHTNTHINGFRRSAAHTRASFTCTWVFLDRVTLSTTQCECVCCCFFLTSACVFHIMFPSLFEPFVPGQSGLTPIHFIVSHLLSLFTHSLCCHTVIQCARQRWRYVNSTC